MSKTISPAFQSHLDQEVTSLATCWRLTRTDGEEFFFTDHDVALLVDGNLYVADSGYKRTAVANDSSLAVDNLNIEGVFDSDEITETDLRAGKFDYAQIRIFVVNWADLSQGILRIRNGRMGEVGLTEQGVFRAELRGLTQQLSQRIGEVYQPECRADLGDSRCKIPIDPDVRLDSTFYELGDFIRVSTAGTPLPSDTQFLVHLNDDTEDLRTTNLATLGANAALQGTVTKFGSGALEFSPSGSSDTTSIASWPGNTAYDLAGQSFAVEGWARFKDLTVNSQDFIARITPPPGVTKGFEVYRSFGNLRAFIVTTGTNVSIFGAVAWATGVWYHIAFTHDIGTNTFRLFLDGTQVASVVNASTTEDYTGDLDLGAKDNSGAPRPLDGFLDEWRITVGSPVYTSNFTPPTTEFPGSEASDDQSQYENRIYEAVVAGTTAAAQPTYDTTVDNVTVDGTAEFEAQQAWMRNGVVDTVTDRSTFTLTSAFDEVRDVDDWFNGGALQFEDGDNDGKTIEIRDWEQSTRTVTLFLPAPFTIASGTLVRLYPGCDKQLSTCRDKFDNVLNFRGEPHVPGQDEFTKYPDAKTA